SHQTTGRPPGGGRCGRRDSVLATAPPGGRLASWHLSSWPTSRLPRPRGRALVADDNSPFLHSSIRDLIRHKVRQMGGCPSTSSKPACGSICDFFRHLVREPGRGGIGASFSPRRNPMSRELYRYTFAPEVPPEEVEATLLLALFAVESLHGEAQVRLDA